MIPQTVGEKFDIGRIAPVQCVADFQPRTLDAGMESFTLLIIREGSGFFRAADHSFEAVAPCLVCFDEQAMPTLLSEHKLRCDAVFFHPRFLNMNMSFERVHRPDYAQVAMAHDLFLLSPFTDADRFVFPLFEEANRRVAELFAALEDQLRTQPDWYWSCRSRSYFMEMLLLLERSYGIAREQEPQTRQAVRNHHLKQALVFLESNYHCPIKLEDITRAASINHATLTQLCREELGVPPMVYLWDYRLRVAKKHLAFTSLPVKDIALRCGFKTVQHFCRKFEKATAMTPSIYREQALARRRAEF